MANTSTTGKVKSIMREHREAWLEYYIARMANGDSIPCPSGDSEAADMIGEWRPNVFRVSQKLKKRVNDTRGDNMTRT